MKFREHDVSIAIDRQIALSGVLSVPSDPSGLVLFAQVSSGSRHASRNRHFAAMLQQNGMATLLLDLLTPAEEEQDRWTHKLRSDIALLGGRVILASMWLRRQPDVYELPIGVFGSGTGAAAALMAAAHESDRIRAVVSSGGRIDLVPGDALEEAKAPTLLIVGGADVPVLAATRATLPKLSGEHQLEIIPGAAQLMEQAGVLELVTRSTRDWFKWHLAGQRPERLGAGIPRSTRGAASTKVPRPSLSRGA